MMTLMAVDPAWLGPSRPCCPCCATAGRADQAVPPAPTHPLLPVGGYAVMPLRWLDMLVADAAAGDSGVANRWQRARSLRGDEGREGWMGVCRVSLFPFSSFFFLFLPFFFFFVFFLSLSLFLSFFLSFVLSFFFFLTSFSSVHSFHRFFTLVAFANLLPCSLRSASRPVLSPTTAFGSEESPHAA